MDEETVPNYGQLYNDTVVSLHKYQFSVMGLLEAVRKGKYKYIQQDGTIHTYIDRIKGSISEIQAIQQKKINLNPDTKQFKNMVTYKINEQSGITSITVEEDSPLPPWIQNL